MALKLYSFRESSLFTQDVYRYLTEESYFATPDEIKQLRVLIKEWLDE